MPSAESSSAALSTPLVMYESMMPEPGMKIVPNDIQKPPYIVNAA